MTLARAIGLAALLTTTLPGLAHASGYSTLEPAEADPDVVITAIIGNQVLLRADGRLLTLWQGDYVRYRGQLYRLRTEGDKMVLIPLEGQPLKILTVDQEG
ncbi:hypothetical protein [Rhodovibrio sodomensis]|nr:hypothetical protein [Rhodovibrio sodomensis]